MTTQSNSTAPETGEPCMVPLTGARDENYFALVDSDDFERVSQYRWGCYLAKSDRRYAARSFKVAPNRRRTVQMHRFILLGLDFTEIRQVDHVNGNPLDNRRSNLRLVTSSQQQQNREPVRLSRVGGYKGVTPYEGATGRRYHAGISLERNGHEERKRIHLGTFDTPEEAALAFDEKAAEIYGGHARLNFPLQRRKIEELERERDALKQEVAFAVANGHKWTLDDWANWIKNHARWQHLEKPNEPSRFTAN